MDIKTFLLGSVPPVLAIFAEWKSPVSSTLIEAQSLVQSEQFVPETVTGADRDAQKDSVAQVITGTAIGAAEASGLVPTWISFITGITAVLVEVIDPKWWIGIIVAVAVITAISAFFGIGFFTSINYYVFGKEASRYRICRNRTGADCASNIVIIANLIIFFILLGFWFLTDTSAGAAILRYGQQLI
jgi:hypothetical protein